MRHLCVVDWELIADMRQRTKELLNTHGCSGVALLLRSWASLQVMETIFPMGPVKVKSLFAMLNHRAHDMPVDGE